ncbi:MAG TPA: xanthine dehydrogenase family protein molybdopterin-binding subunit [Burkholderiales bacterium]|nr:xanthine dehydrogenase family protein molybdopterin-binding subunit [Burkholderiales bacterium]
MKGRLEDRRLLTGQGKYTADWNFPNQAYAVFLRSDRAHAEIVSIDTAAALKAPGVLAVLTGKDIAEAGYKSIPTNLGVKDRFGEALKKPPRPVLAQGKVRHVGECVACIVAESQAAAQDAAELIEVEYRELPAVTVARDALQPGAPQLHAELAGNLSFDWVAGDEAATEAAFRSAARVVKLALDNQRMVGNPMEPRACTATYDAATQKYALYACTQGTAGMRGQLVYTMGVPDDKIDVIAEDVGGGFGVRFNMYPEYSAVLLAAKKTGRPVKWTGSRSEVFLSDEQGRDVASTSELALDASGKFLALRFSYVADLGAYLAPTGPFINTQGVVACLTGVYEIPAACARVQLAVTNKSPSAAYRGAGRPVMSYMIERLVDEAAVELGIDPAELRRRNLVTKEKFPYKAANGITYDCGDFEGVLADALKASDWAGFPARRAESKTHGKLLGRGMATYIEASGGGFAPSDQVELRFSSEGTVTMYAVSHSHGQGHETSYAQIVSAVTGVPMENFRLRNGDPAVRLVGNATGGSRSLLGVGSVMQLAAKQVVEKGLALASKDLEAAAADIEFTDGAYRIKGTDRSVTLIALAKKYAGTPQSLDVKTEGRFGVTFPNGCHVAEVEIEPETGIAEIVKFTAVDDAGNIVNHQIVEGQMQGGITQGAGQVFGEHAVYDPDTGQLLSGSFMDYFMPRAGLVGGLAIHEHPVPTASNPLGAKGVGEAGVSGSLPALMNAVLDALREGGVTHFDMPATPDRIWRALRDAKAG